MPDPSWKQRARSFYDAEAATYVETSYGDDPGRYPANSIRLRHVLAVLAESGARTVLDVGCGSGHPMAAMLDNRIDVVGFDFSGPMVDEARRLLGDRGHDPARVAAGDAEDPASFPRRDFDAVTALGVFPHVINEAAVIRNMADSLAPGGLFIAEFRNGLFSAFTLNRYSYDFYMESFIDSVGLIDAGSPMRRRVESYYREAFKTAEAPTPNEAASGERLSYADLLARFHNPMSIAESLAPAGLEWRRNIYYHFHVLPPALEGRDPGTFRAKSLEMEARYANDWRGAFMASAFVAVATKA